MDKVNRLADGLTARFEKMAYPARLDAASLLKNECATSYEESPLKENDLDTRVKKKTVKKRSYPSTPNLRELVESPPIKRPRTTTDRIKSSSGGWNRRGYFRSRVCPEEPPQTHRSILEAKKQRAEVACINANKENEMVSASPLKPRSFSPKDGGSSNVLAQCDDNAIEVSHEREDSYAMYSEYSIVTERLREIASDLSRRTSRVKELITQPPTPSTGASEKGKEAPDPPPLKRPIAAPEAGENETSLSHLGLAEVGSRRARLLNLWKRFKKSLTFPETVDPQSNLNITWLFVACVCYVYNAWTIPMRSVFTIYQTPDNLPIWLTLDYICDAVYVLDIVIFRLRVQFLDKSGSWVTEPKEIKRYYLTSRRFLFDIVSLLPLDLLYFVVGPVSALRLPRLLKISIFWEFFTRFDSVLSNPFIARMIRTITYMVYTIHLNALMYYGFSKYEGIGSNSWVYEGEGHAYIRCYYFAIKTATSIGKNPKPTNIQEQALMTVAWLAGVFVFAVLLGQVKDIVLTATKNQDDYRRIVDQTLNYLHKFHIPEPTIDRVRLWFTYTWETQKTLDETACLKFLPIKLQLDIAINVHIHTLSKVQLFKDCDENLLRDLVLMLKPVIYLPGDYVCKKGDVGREMYIVEMGEVQVVGGPTGDTVFATLTEGSVFGEIALLAVGGGNRRTADVKSHGFSNLFVLSKEDLEITIKDHPEAQKVLEKKAGKLIRETKSREKANEKEAEAQKNVKKKTSKLLNAVFEKARSGSVPVALMEHSPDSKSFSSQRSNLSISLKNAEGTYADGLIEANDSGACDLNISCDEEEILLVVKTDPQVTKEDSTHVQSDDPSFAQTSKRDCNRNEIESFCMEVIDRAAKLCGESFYKEMEEEEEEEEGEEEEGEEEGEEEEEEEDEPPFSIAMFDDGTIFIPLECSGKKYTIAEEEKRRPLPILYEGVLYPSLAFKDGNIKDFLQKTAIDEQKSLTTTNKEKEIKGKMDSKENETEHMDRDAGEANALFDCTVYDKGSKGSNLDNEGSQRSKRKSKLDNQSSDADSEDSKNGNKESEIDKQDTEISSQESVTDSNERSGDELDTRTHCRTPFPDISKKKGLIDLGGSTDSNNWDWDSSMKLNTTSKDEDGENDKLSVGSFSSRDSFDLEDIPNNIPSTSSSSEFTCPNRSH